MPSMPSGLSRSVTTWVSQVSVSIGATLVATMIYGALPRVTIPRLEPAPVLTSGGKFAARALPPDAPRAFDGLDTMPLPRVAVPTALVPTAVFAGSAQAAVAPLPPPGLQAGLTVAGLPVPASSLSDPVRRLLIGGVTTRSTPGEMPLRVVKPLRPPVHGETKHPARAAVVEAVAPDPTAQLSSGLQDTSADQGVLPRMMSTARGAWSVTASAGDALLAHVVPQIP